MNKNLSVCIVNYGRYSITHEGKSLMILPNTIMALAQASVGLDIELVIADFPSDDPPYDEWLPRIWPNKFHVVHIDGFFSTGRGRNKALASAQGDVIVMLDADMIVPTNFFQIIQEQVLKGFICCPLYRRQIGPGSKIVDDGNGYGNVAFSRELGIKMLEKYSGMPWPEFKIWGSEDVLFAKNAKVELHAPLWREMINGFYHQWHPKTSEWYTNKKGQNT